MSKRPVLPAMPRILYGTAWKDTKTSDLVYEAFVQGFRGVDTAGQRKHYREDLVGAGLARARRELHLCREDIWIQTKYVTLLTRFTPLSGQDLKGLVPYDPAASVADQVCASFVKSLTHLHPNEQVPDVRALLAQYAVRANPSASRTEAPRQAVYLDSYLLHSPLPTLQGTLEAWVVMEALVDAGLVRYIGLSSTCASLTQTCMIPTFFRGCLSTHASSRMFYRIGGTALRATTYRCSRSSRRCFRPMRSHRPRMSARLRHAASHTSHSGHSRATSASSSRTLLRSSRRSVASHLHRSSMRL